MTIEQTVEPQSVRDARAAQAVIDKVARAAIREAKQANKNTANGHADNKPVTWGELRPILVDAGIL